MRPEKSLWSPAPGREVGRPWLRDRSPSEPNEAPNTSKCGERYTSNKFVSLALSRAAFELMVPSARHDRAVQLVVVVERDQTDPCVWRYGTADGTGQLSQDVRQLRRDPATGCTEPIDPPGPHWPTAILLIRQASGPRMEWDVGATMFPPSSRPPTPPAPRTPRGWTRATAGNAKAPGETLQQRASRSTHVSTTEAE